MTYNEPRVIEKSSIRLLKKILIELIVSKIMKVAHSMAWNRIVKHGKKL
jgi:hypothetical protein